MLIRAISLHQIWATAMSRGLKKIETRDDIPMWRTSYRGPIAIHAAKKKFKPEEYSEEFVRVCRDNGLLDSIVYGAVLCIVDLVDRKRTEDVGDIGFPERLFGNYGPDRLALITNNLRVLPEPQPFSGHQGWFAWPVPKQYEHLLATEFKLS
jgi:activating signal cointegrator 1